MIYKLQDAGSVPRIKVAPPDNLENVPVQRDNTAVKQNVVDTGRRSVKKSREQKKQEELFDEVAQEILKDEEKKQRYQTGSRWAIDDQPLQTEHPELAVLFAPEFTTYGVLGGTARVGLGLAGSRAGSYALGSAGNWLDDKLGTQHLGTVGNVVGGLAGYAFGSGAVTPVLRSAAGNGITMGMPQETFMDLRGQYFNQAANKAIPNTNYIGDAEINPNAYYRQGNGLIEDLQNVGKVRVNYIPTEEQGTVGGFYLGKTFNYPMFSRGRLWTKAGEFPDLLTTRDGMNFANKEGSVTSSLTRAGVRRIPHPDFPLTTDNVTAYRWDPNYGYRYVSGPRSWESPNHIIKFEPKTTVSEPYAIVSRDGLVKQHLQYQSPTTTVWTETPKRAFDSTERFIAGQNLVESLERGNVPPIDAHGIAKGFELENLENILQHGINWNRRFDTAPLFKTKGSEGIGSGFGTVSGTAYNDGLFILTSKPKSLLSKGIDSVLINDADPGYARFLKQYLQEKYPNFRFMTYGEAPNYYGVKKLSIPTVEQTTVPTIESVSQSTNSFELPPPPEEVNIIF